MMRRNKASLKKLEVLLADNKKQREELVNLYGKTIETQERLEEMMSMLKMQEAELAVTAQQKRGIVYELGWTGERALALAVLIMFMIMMALGRKVCGW